MDGEAIFSLMLIPIQVIFGAGFGILSARAPAVKTSVWLIVAAIFSTYGLISLFIVENLLNAAAQFAGGKDEFSVVLIMDRKLTRADIYRYLQTLGTYLFLGLIIGAIYSSFGFRGFGSWVNWLLLVLLNLYKFGFNSKVWLTLGIMALSILAASFIGITTAPIAFISLFTANSYLVDRAAEVQHIQSKHWDWNTLNISSIVTGAIGGVTPGVNADIWHTDNPESSPLAGKISGIVAEGVSLSILLCQRDTTKTTLTTFLTQFKNPDIPINPTIIGIILLVLVCVICSKQFEWLVAFAIEQIYPPKWFGHALAISSTAYFIGIPEQPLLSLGLSTGLTISFKYFSNLIGDYPNGFTKVLATSPIIFL